ncbi:hypothetical protein [Arthrobacter sp. JCM 19049]|uniref:hypothetical protein n=1 Tax=Arthrobacter sp. JCM 19049 TaxID=1460643 RepID=UPI0024372F06|nr:hypothetical protein [Arthrobacter sp. JCM 19049]
MGAGHLGYLLGLGGFSLGFALLTALGQRASRLTLILAAVGICGYLSVGLPALGWWCRSCCSRPPRRPPGCASLP